MQRYYSNYLKRAPGLVNHWDIIALIIIFSLLFLLAWGASQMASPYQLGDSIRIGLDPHFLPGYAIRTTLRMFIALLFSLAFTFIFGTWAAKSKRAEQIIIPAVDILQSVPVLSFLSITVAGFIRLFPNSILGPECASIFAIFTAQAWNMVLGFYQSLRTVPHDLHEAADMFQLSAWQRFWRIEVPFSMSSLLWNIMMSMSASWFFVVLSEAISVSNQDIRLPGIGSYIALAIEQANMHAVVYAIITMLIVIFLYDQIIFRPLIKWSEKFKVEQDPDEKSYRSWLVNIMQRTVLVRYAGQWISQAMDRFVNLPLFRSRRSSKHQHTPSRFEKVTPILWIFSVFTLLIASMAFLIEFILRTITFAEIWHVFLLGLATSTRVIALIIISSIVWIPVGVWIGMRPRITQIAQPIIQFLAAFPANLIYPIVVLNILRFNLNVEIWVTPLMILGTQWYILFNVIAGASTIPKDVYQAAQNFNLRGWRWWIRLGLPGVFPYFVTGAVTAAGGAWNASIVAEWVSWGHTTLRATGLGEYIHAYTNAGDFPRIALGTTMMCLFVLAFNRILWQPLYKLAESRYSI